MKVMKWMLNFLVLFIAVLLIPFIGPTLGLTSYEHLIESEGETVTVSAGRLNVRKHTGQGRSVVLVHGHPGSGQMMRPLARALSAHGYDVIRYDRMGWGYSSQRPVDQFVTPSAHATDLLEMVAALNLDSPLFVGYSYGGGVVMEANIAAPDIVRDFVLISSVGKRRAMRGEPGWVNRIFNSPLFRRWAFGTDYTMGVAANAISDQLMYPEDPLPGELEGFLASLSLPNVPSHWQRESQERYVGFEDYQPQRVRGCALILHGQDDLVVPVDTAEFLASVIPGARLQIIDQAGHGMLIAQPEHLAELIVRYEPRCIIG